MSYVEGSYNTAQEAFDAVKRLKAEGYSASDIRLISNKTMHDSIIGQTDVDVTTTDTYERERNHDDESLWEKIKDAFTVDDDYTDYSDDPDNDPLMNYRADIDAGKIVVLVEGDRKGTARTATDAVHTPGTHTTDEETIRLKEEKLDVDKTEVQTGEVHVSKRVVKETETVEVPVEHEEIVIERHPVDSDEKVTGNMTMEEDDITIPIKEEQIHVTKEPVVTEEVTIGKEKRTETKKVAEEVEREELDIDTEGDVDLDRPGTHDRNRTDFDRNL